MKVKELIEALQQCDPDTEVFTEGCNTNEALMVVEYTNKKNNYKGLYIGDDMYYVDDCLLEDYNKKVIMEVKE